MCWESKGIPLLLWIIVNYRHAFILIHPMLLNWVLYKMLLLLLLRNCEYECIANELRRYQDYLFSVNWILYILMYKNKGLKDINDWIILIDLILILNWIFVDRILHYFYYNFQMFCFENVFIFYFIYIFYIPIVYIYIWSLFTYIHIILMDIYTENIFTLVQWLFSCLLRYNSCCLVASVLLVV